MHVVQQKVDAVRRQARRLTRVYGTAWTLLLILVAVLLACSLDYAFRIQEHGIRWMLSAAVAGLATWSVLRFLLPALRYRPSDVEVATRIEGNDPRFQERLSSAVEFLGQATEDPRSGSLELRRAVILEAEQRLDGADLKACLDHRRPRNATLAALAVLLLVVSVVGLDLVLFWNGQRQFQQTPASLLAVYRLTMPWSSADWPRWNALQFVKGPRLLARGRDFEAEVVDARGHLPDRVELQFWFDGDRGDQIQSKLMKPTADGSVVHRLENVTRSFKYRAVGGDHDNMAWIPLRLVEPPRLAAQQIRLHPPAYSGFPPRKSGPRIEALEGTRIEFQGQSSKKLREVRLHTPGEQQGTPGKQQGADIEARLSEDGLQFSIAADAGWQVEDSGRYWVELIDEEGLSGGDESRGEIVARQDQPPTVSLEQPASNTYLTTQARPTLRAVAKDDLAVARIELRYLQSGASDDGEQVLELRAAAEQPPEGDAAADTGRGDKVTLDTTWDLGQIGGLAAGDWIDFHIAASDYRPQWGHSNTRRLMIISQDQLEDRLAQRQSTILARLAEVLQLQRSARSQTQSLEIQLNETGALEKPDIDQLQSAELNQRQIGRQLSEGEEGIPGQIRQLLEELKSNRVDHPDLVRRMEQLRDGLESLGREEVPRIQRHLISALKTSRDHLRRDAGNETADTATSPSVKQAGQGQEQVIAALEAMLGDLTQWDNYRRFAREINRLQREQQEIGQQTDRLRMETLTRQQRDLAPQERADLKRLAQQQADLARRLDKIQSRMQQMQAQLGQSDPLAAETLDDALATARRLAISGLMRESSRSIEENRVGQASQQQEQIEGAIDELLDVLANRREHELDRLLSQLRRAEQDLDEIQRGQAGVEQQLKAAEDRDDPAAARRQMDDAADQEKELAESARQLARRLQRLQAPQAGDSVARAAQQQQQSSEAAGQGQSQDARQQAEDARRQLEQARQQLQQRMEQAEQDLFEEQMARLEQILAGLIGRQRALLDTTVDLHRLQQAQDGKLERGQLATLGDLSQQQRNLATETGIEAEKVARARVFQLGLEGVTREMARAARGLDRREPGPATQRAEQAALARLEQLAEAMRQEESEDAPQEQEQPQGQNPQEPQMSPQEAARMLAELKLVRLMQEEINQRTGQLETIRAESGDWTTEQRQEAADLAREQGRLADLVLELLEQASANQQEQPAEPGGEPPGGEGEQEPAGDLDDLDRALNEELLKDL